MFETKKEPEKPSELTFKADGKTFSASEIIKVLEKLGKRDLTSTAIKDALKLKKETGRDRVRSIMRQLQKAGVVTIEKKALEEGKRERYYYSLMEA